ncbi:hypothetical protein YC2023_014950 [Brassica napus]
MCLGHRSGCFSGDTSDVLFRFQIRLFHMMGHVDSNLRGQSPINFESISLTTRTYRQFMSYFSRAMATTSTALFSMELAAMKIQDALAEASLASGGKLVVLSSFDSFLSESGRPSSWLTSTSQ